MPLLYIHQMNWVTYRNVRLHHNVSIINIVLVVIIRTPYYYYYYYYYYYELKYHGV